MSTQPKYACFEDSLPGITWAQVWGVVSTVIETLQAPAWDTYNPEHFR